MKKPLLLSRGTSTNAIKISSSGGLYAYHLRKGSYLKKIGIFD